ncbi:ATP-binding protein [Pseudorhodoplanes sp.]|uniref:ATP-binding protein n=1 Tax=Pseudorhodoplanes sp. TaxID=1934341 RepID=UPI00391A85D7
MTSTESAAKSAPDHGAAGDAAQDHDERQIIGRVIAVSGSNATVELNATIGQDAVRATVGKFLGVVTGEAIAIGMVTKVAEQSGPRTVSTAYVDMFGELREQNGRPAFSRGITDYPAIGDSALLMTNEELRLVYGNSRSTAHVGVLRQDPSIQALVDVDEMLNKHFAILGTTGVGKSSAVAIILQQVLEARPDLRIFLVDPHNEFGHSFGEKAHVLNPKNMRLPFWLFNFEETVDAFFGGRPGVPDEVEILAEVIPIAKGAYLQYRNTSEHSLIRKRDPKNSGFTPDTPAPYRLEDLLGLIDERMGKLENRASRAQHFKLMQRIQTFRNNPRYAFMFENANVGGDTMAEIISNLFRLPARGKPVTVMQLAGFPAEVVDAVVSVLCRMAFDFGLWSDGVAPLLFVCEEAHRYASAAEFKKGFGPTRRALSRIAKEGRKHGVYLGLITQRPFEIDPNIISQCNTLFVMRLANERDQALIKSAVSDAAASLLAFVPSLGTGEAFVFGSGVALPMQMIFSHLPEKYRPVSDVGHMSYTSEEAGLELISSVIDRWRNATMSQKLYEDEGYDSGFASPPIQPTPPQPPRAAEPPRSGLLKQPLSAAVAAADSQKKWR